MGVGWENLRKLMLSHPKAFPEISGTTTPIVEALMEQEFKASKKTP
jgi:hypothetical protein